jgi:hypothetical protein
MDQRVERPSANVDAILFEHEVIEKPGIDLGL